MAEVPELLAMWATDLNDGVDPGAVGVRSSRTVWWRCAAGHVWQAMVTSKAGAPGRCGRCPRVQHPALSVGRPDLIAQWATELNEGLDLDPTTLRCGSAARAWWRCTAGHVWQARIDTRALRGRDCPTCAGGRRAAPRLTAVAGWLLQEWAGDLNPGVDPDTVSARSNRLLWWRCRNQQHVWQQTVSDRTRGRGCPACFATRGEREVEVLHAVAAATGLRYDGHPCPARPVNGLRDLVDDVRRVVVEYDEMLHKFRVKQDQALTTRLLAAGYTVIRIRERGLPDVGGITVDVAVDAPVDTIAAHVVAVMQAAGFTPSPATTVPVVLPRQSAPSVSERALYPEREYHRALLPAPQGPAPASVRDHLQAALVDLLADGRSLNSRGLVRQLVEVTGASTTYAKYVVAEARRLARATSLTAMSPVIPRQRR